jgi:hypothetical protein
MGYWLLVGKGGNSEHSDLKEKLSKQLKAVNDT